MTRPKILKYFSKTDGKGLKTLLNQKATSKKSTIIKPRKRRCKLGNKYNNNYYINS